MLKKNLLIAALMLWVTCIGAQWQLVWSDEFNYTGLPDASKWNFEDWAPGMVNNELQRYTPNRTENCRVENGKLIIEARRDWYNGSEYSSARINSSKKGFWKYGRMEARIKLPGGRGTWPAFWMMPEDITKYGWNSETNYWWPNSGEIDILEEVGYEPNVIHGSVHSEKFYFKKGNQRSGQITINDATSAFHVYAIEWWADKIDFFVDGTKYFTVTNDGSGWQSYPFDHDFHIIFNLAVGGAWGGYMGVDPNIWPRKLEVDYVRVYKPSSTPPPPPPPCATFMVPVKIEAENYCEMKGIQTENCSEGTKNVGWIDASDWMDYNIKVATTGNYEVSYRVASPGGAKLRLDKDGGSTNLGSSTVPGTGGWQSWTTIAKTVSLPAGTYKIRLYAETGGFNINWIDIKPVTSCPTYAVPGKIEAENYCQMQGIQTENCSEGTQNVGWIDANDWMTYNISVASAGTYQVSYRVASPNSGAQLKLEKDGGATTLGTVNIPQTGGWQNWTTVKNTVTLPAGNYSIRIKANVGGFNINWIDVQANSQQSFYTKIEAENYNSMSGVQTENCSEGTKNVGWIDATDWMSYNVNLPYTGTYTVKYRVASPNSSGSLILSKNATDIITSSIPNTGGWQNWTTVSVNVDLVSGQQALALYAKSGGFNVNWWSIEWGANGAKSAQADENIALQQQGNSILDLYPNPVSGQLYINVHNTGAVRVKLFGTDGKLAIETEIVENGMVDVSGLKPGIYILKAANKATSQTEKVIVN